MTNVADYFNSVFYDCDLGGLDVWCDVDHGFKGFVDLPVDSIVGLKCVHMINQTRTLLDLFGRIHDTHEVVYPVLRALHQTMAVYYFG